MRTSVAFAFFVACGPSERREREPATEPQRAPAPEISRLDPPAANGAMGLTLLADGDGVLATWIESKRVRFSRLVARRWSPPVTIVDDPTLLSNFADFPALVRSGTHLYCAFGIVPDPEVESIHVHIARSPDDGRSWTRIGRLHDDESATEHGFVSLVTEGGGVRAVWLDGREMAGAGPMTLRSAHVDGSIGPSEVVDPRVCECCGTGAAATSDGVVVVYRDRSDDEVRDIGVARRASDAWQASRTVHSDSWRVPGCPVNGPRVAARGNEVAAAWFTYAESRARVRTAFSSDAGATWRPPIEVDAPEGRESPIGRVDVSMLPTGEAIVSWVDGDREAASIRARRVGSDGRVGAPVEIARTRAGRESGFPRMALVGEQVIAGWTEPGDPSRVRVAVLPVAAIPPLGRRPVESGARPDPVLSIGSPVPPLQALTLDGQPASLASLRGQVFLVNLWATWCEPCRQELPELVSLHERHAGAGLRVVAVSVDAEKSAADLRAFVERRRIPFTVWHDRTDAASRVFGAQTLPATFLFDREGKLVFHASGAIRADDPALAAALRDAFD